MDKVTKEDRIKDGKNEGGRIRSVLILPLRLFKI